MPKSIRSWGSSNSGRVWTRKRFTARASEISTMNVKQPTITQAIMVALLVWGGYLALGAIRAPGNHATWRGLIVFGCTLAFLAIWAAALAVRKRRTNQP